LGVNTKPRINRDKPYVDDLSCRHQPPLVLPRRGDADYFAFCQRLGDADYSGSVKDLEMQITLRSVKDLEMQITLVLSKTWRCRLLYVVDNLLIIRWLQAIVRPPEYLSLPYGGG